jgi:hypothetical protein
MQSHYFIMMMCRQELARSPWRAGEEAPRSR